MEIWKISFLFSFLPSSHSQHSSHHTISLSLVRFKAIWNSTHHPKYTKLNSSLMAIWFDHFKSREGINVERRRRRKSENKREKSRSHYFVTREFFSSFFPEKSKQRLHKTGAKCGRTVVNSSMSRLGWWWCCSAAICFAEQNKYKKRRQWEKSWKQTNEPSEQKKLLCSSFARCVWMCSWELYSSWMWKQKNLNFVFILSTINTWEKRGAKRKKSHIDRDWIGNVMSFHSQACCVCSLAHSKYFETVRIQPTTPPPHISNHFTPLPHDFSFVFIFPLLHSFSMLLLLWVVHFSGEVGRWGCEHFQALNCIQCTIC